MKTPTKPATARSRGETIPVDILNPDGSILCTCRKFPTAALRYIEAKAKKQKKSRDYIFNAMMRRMLKIPRLIGGGAA